MTTTAHLPPNAAVERYVRFWNAETSEEQWRIAAEVLNDDVEYHAVTGVSTGVAALVDFRREFIEHVGPATYRALAAPDHHHDRVRLRWEIVLADGTSFAAGTDVLNLVADGRIASITAFLERAPEGFDHAENDEAADAAS